jgi:hypothetical protein
MNEISNHQSKFKNSQFQNKEFDRLEKLYKVAKRKEKLKLDMDEDEINMTISELSYRGDEEQSHSGSRGGPDESVEDIDIDLLTTQTRFHVEAGDPLTHHRQYIDNPEQFRNN